MKDVLSEAVAMGSENVIVTVMALEEVGDVVTVERVADGEVVSVKE